MPSEVDPGEQRSPAAPAGGEGEPDEGEQGEARDGGTQVTNFEQAEARRRARSRRRTRRWRLAGRYLVLSLLAFVVMFPLLVMVVNSLLRPSQLFETPPSLWPSDMPGTGSSWVDERLEDVTGGPPQWGTYDRAWERGNMALYLRNSTIVTLVIVVGQVATSILGGYAFALLRFPFKRTIFVSFLATMMLPFELTIVTNLATVDDLGWHNTYQAMAVPFLATGMGVFLLRQAFLQIPPDLQDAARVDGYGHLRFLLRVAIPLARPMIAALTVFSFLGAWNQYLWPLLVTENENVRTVQIGLEYLRNSTPESLNVVFAGAVLAVLPLMVILLVFQKQLIRGMTAGAVKG